MDRNTETELITQGLSLVRENARFLEPSPSGRDSHHYINPDRFDHERIKIFKQLPHAVAHASELPTPNDFLVREVNGQSALITRGPDGTVRAFRNVCRHRGMKLVTAPSGCKQRFVCPYHAWTYGTDGNLITAPHFEEGFPTINRADTTLMQFAAVEGAGLIWIATSPTTRQEDIRAYLAPVLEELEGLNMASLAVAAETILDVRANWKLLVEGGLEAYHFKVAHRNTIGPYFSDNQSTYQTLGPHIRSVLLRRSFGELANTDAETQRLRDHANLLYTLPPTTQLLVQQDHVIWISATPLGPDLTKLRLVTLGHDTIEDPAYWSRNHGITEATLREDFEIAEQIQRGISMEHPQRFHFGRFEGALEAFNRTVDEFLAEA